RIARLAALTLTTSLALGVTPAHADSWGGSLTEIERKLAQHIMSSPSPTRPEAAPTSVVRFHVTTPIKKGTVTLAAHKLTAKPKPKPRPKAEPKRRPSARRPKATPSYYIRTVDQGVMYQKGCRAGEHRAYGIVILAFGKPYYDGHSYGSMTFNLRFAS